LANNGDKALKNIFLGNQREVKKKINNCISCGLLILLYCSLMDRNLIKRLGLYDGEMPKLCRRWVGGGVPGLFGGERIQNLAILPTPPGVREKFPLKDNG